MAWLIRLANGMQMEVEGSAPLAPTERAEIEAHFDSPITSMAPADESPRQPTGLFAGGGPRIPELHTTMVDRGFDIAIIGMAGRFPGADSIDQLWKVLAEGHDPICEIPSSRWSTDRYYDPRPAIRGKTNSRWSGLLEGVEQFDAGLFGVAPREAQYMDPQHRLLLETCWEVLEHAGYGGRALADLSVGVFVGASANEYLHRFLGQPECVERYLGSGNAMSMIANRLSFQFDFKGPSLTIDTACSSSLVAVHLACQSLANGECQVAVAGGVNVLLSPEMYVNCSQARMLSADGRCKTFDQRADGYVRSEGVGLVLLKPLALAVAAGDTVHAVIRATGVNQDGRTSGLTVPNGTAQTKLLHRIYGSSDLSVDTISYLEAHGTGTSLGDPIEVAAASAVFGAAGRRQQCGLGSLKTNLGHLEAAAGIASLIKVTLALKHRKLPPNLHLAAPNEHIRFEETPFYVIDQPTQWRSPVGAARRAGVSAFGFGGTNAHLVLEEALAITSADDPIAPRPELFALSACSRLALEQLAARHGEAMRASLCSKVGSSSCAADLADTCFTLLTGRSHLPYRLAIVGNGPEELLQALASPGFRAPDESGVQLGANWILSVAVDGIPSDALLENARRQLDVSPPEVVATIVRLARGAVWAERFASSVATIDVNSAMQVPARFRRELLLVVGALFAAGVDLDWDALFAGESRRRVPLPTYPFQRSRYWFEPPTRVDHRAITAATSSLEPRAKQAIRAQQSAPYSQTNDVHFSPEPSGESVSPLAAQVAQCCYVQRWVESALGTERQVPSGAWLLLVDDFGIADQIGAILNQHGERVICVRSAGRFHGLMAGDSTGQFFHASVDPGSLADFRRLMAALAAQGLKLAGVIHAWLLSNSGMASKSGLSEKRLADLVAKGPGSLFALARIVGGAVVADSPQSVELAGAVKDSTTAVATPDRNQTLELWLLTAGPERRAGSEFHIADPQAAALRAYGEVLDLEYPTLSVRQVGLPVDAVPADELAGAVWRELSSQRTSYSVALEPSGAAESALREVPSDVSASGVAADSSLLRRYSPALVPYNPPANPNAKGIIDPRATYLITGGLGFIGLQYARALIEDGARSLVLVSRTGATEETMPDLHAVTRGPDEESLAKLHALRDLRASGADVRVIAGDVADFAFVRRLIDELDRRPRRLGGIIHAAGVLSDGLICTRSDTDLINVLRPKAWGVEAISSAIAGRQLDWIHFCSSMASLNAEPGHAAYAAANAYLDAVGARLRQQGFACSVVNWGPWAGARAASSSGYRRLMARRNAADLDPALALAALRHALRATEPQLAVINLHAAQREKLAAAIDDVHGDGTICELRWQAAAAAAVVEHERPHFAESIPIDAGAVIDRCCADYVESLLADAGLFGAAGDTAAAAEIADRLMIAAPLVATLPGLLDILVDDKAVVRTDSGYRAVRAMQVRTPDLALDKLGSQYPAVAASLGLLKRCGDALGDILAGRRSVLQLLFAPGHRHELHSVYSASPWTAPLQRALARILAAAASYSTSEQPFRILEVGAGTGSTTAHLLAQLTPGTFRYTFSDVSPRLVRDAQRLFNRPEFRFTLFDLERPLAEQGLGEHTFDVIVAADVVHATSRIDGSLGQLARLLVPGGLLLLLEATRIVRFSQLTFGLTEGWWRFQGDPRRSNGPLLPPGHWVAALQSHGFDPASAIPATEDLHGTFDHHLFVARSAMSIACSRSNELSSPSVSSELANKRADFAGRSDSPDRTDQPSWLEPLQRILSEILELPIAELALHRPFHEQGLDSLMVLEVIEVLRCNHDIAEVSPSFFFEHPTLVDLAAALLARFGPPERYQIEVRGHTQSERPEREKRLPSPFVYSAGRANIAEPIAVVGYACRLPGADNAVAFWRLLCNSASAVRSLAANRVGLAQTLRYDESREALLGADLDLQGGFLPDVSGFDPLFFHISPREAAFLDPRQRLFLQTAYHALEQAGYGGTALRDSRCGTFVGCGPEDYLNDRSSRELGEYWATGASPATLASRLAYFLDLRGPAVPVDTACSSSLVAVQLAMESLRAGGCQFAVAGGVHLNLRLANFAAFQAMGALARGGRCRAFDQRADGFVPSEGVAVVVLRPLA
ncbi:MAG: beta-ketoacyl synthase N-terminal-like domain-containing protein, partial [Pirellulales bacterium]